MSVLSGGIYLEKLERKFIMLWDQRTDVFSRFIVQREMGEPAEENGFFSNHKINDRNIYVSFRVYVQIKTHSPACLLDRLRDVIEKHPTPSPSFLLAVSVLQFIYLLIILQNSVTL